jgi:YidC/Oxa1 family membrane protein insertase
MDTRRLILVLIFTFSSFMLWENWQKYNQPKPVAEAANAADIAGAAPIPSAALQAKATPGEVQPAAPASTAATFTVATDLIKATISEQGGDLVELELLKYKAHEDKSKNFFLFDAKHQYAAQSGLIGEGMPNHRTLFKHVAGPTSLADGANELKVRLEATASNGAKVAKILTFKRGSYDIDVTWEINNTTDKPLTPNAYFQLQRDDVKPEGETKMVSTFTGAAVYTDADKYQKVDFAHIAENKAKFSRTPTTAGWPWFSIILYRLGYPKIRPLASFTCASLMGPTCSKLASLFRFPKLHVVPRAIHRSRYTQGHKSSRRLNKSLPDLIWLSTTVG